MRCPNCGQADLRDQGSMRECPSCHYITYFQADRADAEQSVTDFDMEF